MPGLVVNDRGDLSVGRDLQILGLMLFAGADVYPVDLIVEAHFLKRDGHFVAVGCAP
jgi:hypothetical protein